MFHRYTLTVALLALATTAYAAEPVGVDERSISGAAVETNGVRGAVELAGAVSRVVEPAYQTPVSFELPPSLNEPGAINMIDFNVPRNQSLKLTLDKLVDASNGALQWQEIHDSIVVYPKQSEEHKLCMDAIVSVQVENASVLEALQAVEEAVNVSGDCAEPFSVLADGAMHMRAPAPALLEPGVVTLAVAKVTAREAICLIMAQAPAPMSYQAMNGPGYQSIIATAYDKEGKVDQGSAAGMEEMEAFGLSDSQSPRGWRPELPQAE